MQSITIFVTAQLILAGENCSTNHQYSLGINMNPQDSSPNNSFDGQGIISPSSYGVTQELSENIILTTLDDLYNWARLSSLYPLLYGTACCLIEFAALIGSRFDFDRFKLNSP
jgi:NAD(P)H-quinone oxidoreductase subunit K